MQLVLQLTRDCNFACRYCYQSHRPGRGMPPEVATRAVEFLLEQGHSRVAVTYFGGEPLLERAVIETTLPRIIELGRRRGALVSAKVSTNGALLDEELCAFARRHLLFISLSADGSPRVQDEGRPARDGGSTSRRVEDALDALRRTRTPFCTYSVVTPANAAGLSRSIDWLYEHGSRILITSLDFGADWTDHALDVLAREYRALARRYVRWTKAGVDFHLSPFDAKISAHTHGEAARSGACAAGVRQIAVDPEGYVYPCVEFLESAEFRIGHIDRGLDREAAREVRARAGGKRPDECSGCGIKSRCASSCACLNYRVTGRMREVDALLCAHEKIVTLAADRIGAHLWRKKSRPFLDRQYNPYHHALFAVESMLAEGSNG